MRGIVISKNDAKEIMALANSLGYEIVKVFSQKKNETAHYIGKGKLQEVKEFIENNEIEIVFVDDELKPSQWYNLEDFLERKVYDRIRLILEVFADRANRKEAKLQVKLAKLRYEKPFVRELIHRLKEKERPGFLAGGEYMVADYYEMIKRQMKRIKEELKKIEKEREVRRKDRKEKGFYLVSIAGYTNAGKSSLLKLLTGENVLVEERLFSTLSTTTSKMKNFRKYKPVLLTDTVGFIKNLPHWLIDAFHSTLEEIELSDVVILLVDASDEMEELKEKTLTSMRELKRMEKHPETIVALNKIDLLDEDTAMKRKRLVEELIGKQCIPISIKNRINVDRLIYKIYEKLPSEIEMEIYIPNGEYELIKWIYEKAEVEEMESGEEIKMKIRCSERIAKIMEGKCRKAGGKVRLNGYGR
ncbi:MAG: GTPase HflX [Thermoplasmata archaeon]|nr:GTPase HflX [Thermoplasmata archaeon]